VRTVRLSQTRVGVKTATEDIVVKLPYLSESGSLGGILECRTCKRTRSRSRGDEKVLKLQRGTSLTVIDREGCARGDEGKEPGCLASSFTRQRSASGLLRGKSFNSLSLSRCRVLFVCLQIGPPAGLHQTGIRGRQGSDPFWTVWIAAAQPRKSALEGSSLGVLGVSNRHVVANTDWRW
jgi:hypothetical protein